MIQKNYKQVMDCEYNGKSGFMLYVKLLKQNKFSYPERIRNIIITLFGDPNDFTNDLMWKVSVFPSKSLLHLIYIKILVKKFIDKLRYRTRRRSTEQHKDFLKEIEWRPPIIKGDLGGKGYLLAKQDFKKTVIKLQ
jgi:hypothetical protein